MTSDDTVWVEIAGETDARQKCIPKHLFTCVTPSMINVQAACVEILELLIQVALIVSNFFKFVLTFLCT